MCKGSDWSGRVKCLSGKINVKGNEAAKASVELGKRKK
jgi:hypothetical protein